MKARLFEAVVLILFLAVCTYQLFIPPLMGIADNGDFERMRVPNGISRVPTEATDQRFDYYVSKFAIVPQPNVGIYYYHSSTHLFVSVARWLNVLLISDRIFDVRVLAAVYTICFLAGIEMILLFSRPWPFIWRCLLAASLLVMFTDTAYTAYFSSFYSEPTAFVALLILVGCSLLIMSRQWTGWIALSVYFATAAVLVTAKPMYVPFAVLFAPFGVYLSRFLSTRIRYRWSIAMAGVLVVLAIAYQSITPNWLRMKASYIAVFSELLKKSPDPAADLKALQLKPEWIRYVGTTPYDADGPVETDPKFPAEFMEHIHTLTIPRFLIGRPAQFYRVAAEVAPQMVQTLPDYAGFYEESSARPARSKPVAHWSSIRARFFPARLWMLIGYFMTGVIAFFVALRKGVSEFTRGLLFLFTLLVGFGAILFVVPVLTMASIDTRYSATFTSAFDLSLITAAGMLIWLLWRLFDFDAKRKHGHFVDESFRKNSTIH